VGLNCTPDDGPGILRRSATCVISWSFARLDLAQNVTVELVSDQGAVARSALGLPELEVVRVLSPETSAMNLTFQLPLATTLSDSYAIIVRTLNNDNSGLKGRKSNDLRVVSTQYVDNMEPMAGADSDCSSDPGSSTDDKTGACVCSDGFYGFDCGHSETSAVAGFTLRAFRKVYFPESETVVRFQNVTEEACANACLDDDTCDGFNFGLSWTTFAGDCELITLGASMSF
jgi:hypothetical protein